MIEQHTSFAVQLDISRIINNATDVSRKYLNDLFMRKTLPSLKNTDTLIYAQNQLQQKIKQYSMLK